MATFEETEENINVKALWKHRVNSKVVLFGPEIYNGAVQNP